MVSQKAVNGSCRCRMNNNGRRPSPARIVAVDCEMVGVGVTRQSALARCTVVDYNGEVIFDCFVKPDEPITDYRTRYSGVMPHHMTSALPFKKARKKIKRLLKDKMVVGHALHMDLKALRLTHPLKHTRDTSKNAVLRDMAALPSMTTPSLRNLTLALLERSIQEETHCSLEDARATMDLYKLVEHSWQVQPECNHTKHYLSDAFWPTSVTASS